MALWATKSADDFYKASNDEKNPSLLGVKEFLDYVMTKHPELNKMQMSGEKKLDWLKYLIISRKLTIIISHQF